MEKYFINPSKMDISEFVRIINSLHDKLKPNFNYDNPRMVKKNQISYKELLADEGLEKESQSIDKVLNKLVEYSQGIVKWNHPGTMININPPASIPSVAASSYFSLYNPNAAQDMSTGLLISTELAVSKMLCELVGWNPAHSGGIFTFGGKSTNLHSVKHGLQRISTDYQNKGIKDEVVVLCSKQGHPCHSEVCGWLGIGEDNCKRIETDENGIIDLKALEKSIINFINEGKKIATIILNGGTTIQMTVDPIEEVVMLRDKIVEKYELDYIPRIHVDSVIGWIFMMFKYYDFDENPYKIDNKALNKLKHMYEAISKLELADSFGVDFHKTGYCSYLSSMYMVKDYAELYKQGNTKPIPYEELEYGNYSPFQYTLELSRSIQGPISAYVNLKLFGIEGYQKIIAKLMTSAQYLKDKLALTDTFEVINNDDSNGFVTLFIAKEDYSAPSFFELGKLELEKIQSVGEYNYKFYLYLLEKQKKNEISFAIDYSSGYHILENGKKIGVLKAYPMSPYFDKKYVDKFMKEINLMKEKFDKEKNEFVLKEVPHKPRPFVFK